MEMTLEHKVKRSLKGTNPHTPKKQKRQTKNQNNKIYNNNNNNSNEF